MENKTIYKTLTKKQILEMIDSNNNLIGDDDTPKIDINADTQAKKTTDDNAEVAHQKYGLDFLGRFGFYFYESEDINNKTVKSEVLDKLENLFKSYSDKIEVKSNENISKLFSKKVLNILKPYLKDALDEISKSTLDEVYDINSKKMFNVDNDIVDLIIQIAQKNKLIDKLNNDDLVKDAVKGKKIDYNTLIKLNDYFNKPNIEEEDKETYFLRGGNLMKRWTSDVINRLNSNEFKDSNKILNYEQGEKVPDLKEKELINKKIKEVINAVSEYIPHKLLDLINNKSYKENDYKKVQNFILTQFEKQILDFVRSKNIKRRDIDENYFTEDKITEKPTEDKTFVKKKNDDLNSKKIKGVGDLVKKKMNKSEINKLIEYLNN